MSGFESNQRIRREDLQQMIYVCPRLSTLLWGQSQFLEAGIINKLQLQYQREDFFKTKEFKGLSLRKRTWIRLKVAFIELITLL